MKQQQRDQFLTFKLSEIDKLSVVMIVCKRKLEYDIKMRLGKLGARVLLSCSAKGISRKPILEILGLVSVEMQVIFAIARSCDTEKIVETIGTEFEFLVPGNGKAFACDIDGYLGAKGPFVEV